MPKERKTHGNDVYIFAWSVLPHWHVSVILNFPKRSILWSSMLKGGRIEIGGADYEDK